MIVFETRKHMPKKFNRIKNLKHWAHPPKGLPNKSKKIGSTKLKLTNQKNKLGSATVTLSRRKAKRMQTGNLNNV
jgi:hypothetical protein